jgi:hypothetical protein
VRVKGLEPPLPYGKQILSLPRLPFRHTRTQARMCMLDQAETRGAALSLMSAARVDAAARSADRPAKRLCGGSP